MYTIVCHVILYLISNGETLLGRRELGRLIWRGRVNGWVAVSADNLPCSDIDSGICSLYARLLSERDESGDVSGYGDLQSRKLQDG
jgi:hypothetical protein